MQQRELKLKGKARLVLKLDDDGGAISLANIKSLQIDIRPQADQSRPDSDPRPGGLPQE